MEENPWDVFETFFTVGSIHEGTIIESLDKGAVIALPYGVEGFATPKHLVKEDGSTAKVEEKLLFKVIEFNKEARRIILSHSRIFEDEQKIAKSKEGGEKKSGRGSFKQDTLDNTNPAIEKTTLGDIEELVALKEKMKAADSGKKVKASKPKTKKKELENDEAVMPEIVAKVSEIQEEVNDTIPLVIEETAVEIEHPEEVIEAVEAVDIQLAADTPATSEVDETEA